MFGINGGEALVLLAVVALVVGPQRLPQYAEQLAHFARAARRQFTAFKSELGDDLDLTSDVDWSTLDPRRYDPRRIVRDALSETSPGPESAAAGASPRARKEPRAQPSPRLAAGSEPPYDDEAT